MKPTRAHGTIFGLGVIAVMIAMATPVIASAQQRGMGRAFGGSEGQRLWTQLDQRFDEFTQELSLSDAQMGLITLVVDDFREANEDALGRLRAMMADMRGLRQGGGRPNRQAMAGVAEKHGNPVQELAPAFEELKTNVAALLDPEQVESLTKMLTQRRRPGG